MEHTYRHRLVVIDISRIICALLIYGSHSILIYECTYQSMIDKIICVLQGPIMTFFFMMSGFSLYYQYYDKDIDGSFYKKRIISIFPSYLIAHILFLLFNPNSFKDWLILLPAELMGIQSAYNTLFGILDNGGTWFVSCMLFCYFVYPTLQKILLYVDKKWKIALILGVYLIIIYSNCIVRRYEMLSNYSNPFFRILEFTIGAGICSVFLKKKDGGTTVDGTTRMSEKFIFSSGGVILCFVLIDFICLLTLEFKSEIGMINLMINYVTLIPFFVIILIMALKIRMPVLEKSKMVRLLSNLSYQFYLMQLYLWSVTSFVMNAFGLHGNFFKILISFFICFLGALVIYYIDKKSVKKLKLMNKRVRNSISEKRHHHKDDRMGQ